MNRKKVLLAAALILLIVLSVVIGMIWHGQNYVLIGFQAYPKNAEQLDLRDEAISIAHYNKLQRRLPDCEILWNVPFQGESYPQDIQQLKVSGITAEDAQVLAYFKKLKTLDARGYTDYALLQMVQDTYPDMKILYTLNIGGKEYDQDAQVLLIDGITAEEVTLVQYLPRLCAVRLESGKNPEQLKALADICSSRGIPIQVMLDGTGYGLETQTIQVEGITTEELELLHFLPQLKEVLLADPVADPQSLIAFVQNRTETEVLWEKTILGVRCTTQMQELDLTSGISENGKLAYEQAKFASVQGERDAIPYLFAINNKYPLPDMTDSTYQLISQVEQGLAYFPNIEQVVMGGCILDNEIMAAFRAAHRQEYKVVWSVQLGNKMIARTDTPYLMPTKYHVYYFLDTDAENLKYCEDMICIDLGHMAVSKIDWVTNMPNLQYLVLAHSQVQRIDAISSCKKLKFLELDWSPIRDYTPLKECTALEDLNLGETFADFTPVGQMTWLKNLWMVGCSRGPAYRMTEALTDTKVVVSGSATVSGGWRNLENYYAMRDCMGMYYMGW